MAFFLSFIILCDYVLVNIIIAVIVDNFVYAISQISSSGNDNPAEKLKEKVVQFNDAWGKHIKFVTFCSNDLS